jgi:phospholipase/carboxylesterase
MTPGSWCDMAQRIRDVRAGGGAAALHARPRSTARPPGLTPGRHILGRSEGRDGALFVPEGLSRSAPAPLIVALHGAGGTASQALDLFAVAAEARRVLILAPESRGRTWDVMLGRYGPDVRFIDDALEHVFERQAVDPGRIAVGGFSDGASYALSLGLTNGDLFSEILAFSPGFMAPTAQVGAPRIFVSHGLHDEVLAIESCSGRLVPKLREAGYIVFYHAFDGGHVVPPAVAAAAMAWFLG